MIIDYFANLQRVKREYTRFLEPVCRQWSLTRNEVDVLLFLHNNPELDRAADIVQHRGMAKSHVSLSVGTLEEKKLLSRIDASGDRRTVHLRLTEQGMHIAAQACEIQQNFFKVLFNGVSAEEIAVWRKILVKIENNIKNLTDF